MFKTHANRISTVIGIIFFTIIIYLLAKHPHVITDIILKSGSLAPLVAIGIYPLLALTPIPADPVTVIIATIYGPITGVLIAITGMTMAVMVEYLIGTKIGDSLKFEKDKEKIPFGLGKLPIESIPVLLFGRMIPGYGSKIVSILAGMHKVPMRRYLWTSIVMNLSGALFLILGGLGLIELIK